MWYTSKSDRILSGAEAELFRIGADSLLTHVADTVSPDDWPTGIPLFDELLPGQKVAMLREVSMALLREDVPPPRLNALNEATVAAVFEEVHDEIEAEIEFDNGPELRQAVVDALMWASKELKYEVTPPSADSDDMVLWRRAIDCCMDFILWDRDFEFEDILDAPPELAVAQRKNLGIVDDYFTAIPPDPTREQAQRQADELHRLLAE